MGAVLAISEHEKRSTNLNSITTAKLGTVVSGMFAGKNSKRAEVKDFLPFEFETPEDINTTDVKTTQKPTKETKTIFWKLTQKVKLPPEVISALIGDIK